MTTYRVGMRNNTLVYVAEYYLELSDEVSSSDSIIAQQPAVGTTKSHKLPAVPHHGSPQKSPSSLQSGQSRDLSHSIEIGRQVSSSPQRNSFGAHGRFFRHAAGRRAVNVSSGHGWTGRGEVTLCMGCLVKRRLVIQLVTINLCCKL